MRSMLKLSTILVALGATLSAQPARACGGLFRCIFCCKSGGGYAYPAVGYGTNYGYMPPYGYAYTSQYGYDDRRPVSRDDARMRRPADASPEVGERLTRLEAIVYRQDEMETRLRRLELRREIEPRYETEASPTYLERITRGQDAKLRELDERTRSIQGQFQGVKDDIKDLKKQSKDDIKDLKADLPNLIRAGLTPAPATAPAVGPGPAPK
jgi:hypothetical protein